VTWNNLWPSKINYKYQYIIFSFQILISSAMSKNYILCNFYNSLQCLQLFPCILPHCTEIKSIKDHINNTSIGHKHVIVLHTIGIRMSTPHYPRRVKWGKEALPALASVQNICDVINHIKCRYLQLSVQITISII